MLGIIGLVVSRVDVDVNFVTIYFYINFQVSINRKFRM